MYDKILESEIGAEAEAANNELYENFGNITYFISDYLREKGFETCVAHPREEKINFSKIAERANREQSEKAVFSSHHASDQTENDCNTCKH